MNKTESYIYGLLSTDGHMQAKVAYMYFKDNDYEWVEE